MRVWQVVALATLIAGPALAQSQKPMPRYGETDPPKTQAEIQAEKDKDAAYQRSLGNIPAKGAGDPWGGVRGDPPAKPAPVAKSAAAKKKAAPTPQ